MLLLAASYGFLAAWDPRFVLFIGVSTLIDFAVGLKLAEEAGSVTRDGSRTRRVWLAVSVVSQVTILCAFKYFNFFADSLADLAARFGIVVQASHLSIAVPLGISFYTFKTLTYTIDSYYRRTPPCRRLSHYALYVAFFPELTAGPIDRARALLPQIEAGATMNRASLLIGLNLVLLGLFKKVFVADNLAPLVASDFGVEGRIGFDAALPVYIFAVQIYCDFSGYTDMARGIGKWLGFDLTENFRSPYLAWSPSDFWSRWHISFSSWLRDYVFLPLGGAWRSAGHGYKNLLLTMIVAGLWHGAAWTFVIWGAYWGMLLVAHRGMQATLKRLRRRTASILPARSRRLIEVALTFHLVCLGWVFFRSESLSQGWAIMSAVAHPRLPTQTAPLLAFAALTAPLLALEWLQIRYGRLDLFREGRIHASVRVVAYTVIIYLVAFHAARTQSFIYATF